jgi:hypothetical protein
MLCLYQSRNHLMSTTGTGVELIGVWVVELHGNGVTFFCQIN